MAEEPDDFHPRDPRFYVPRSGFQFLADVTGRALSAIYWFDLRMRQALGAGYGPRGIHRLFKEEIPQRRWEN